MLGCFYFQANILNNMKINAALAIRLPWIFCHPAYHKASSALSARYCTAQENRDLQRYSYSDLFVSADMVICAFAQS